MNGLVKHFYSGNQRLEKLGFNGLGPQGERLYLPQRGNVQDASEGKWKLYLLTIQRLTNKLQDRSVKSPETRTNFKMTAITSILVLPNPSKEDNPRFHRMCCNWQLLGSNRTGCSSYEVEAQFQKASKPEHPQMASAQSSESAPTAPHSYNNIRSLLGKWMGTQYKNISINGIFRDAMDS